MPQYFIAYKLNFACTAASKVPLQPQPSFTNLFIGLHVHIRTQAFGVNKVALFWKLYFIYHT